MTDRMLDDLGRPTGSYPLTEDQLNTIADRNERLYKLWNTCSSKGSWWESSDQAVDILMRHLNEEFPGYDVALLLKEVQRLKDLIESLPCPIHLRWWNDQR